MVSLRRIEPEKNMARFYEISLQPTLFGDVAVVRHWGRIGGGADDRFNSRCCAGLATCE